AVRDGLLRLHEGILTASAVYLGQVIPRNREVRRKLKHDRFGTLRAAATVRFPMKDRGVDGRQCVRWTGPLPHPNGNQTLLNKGDDARSSDYYAVDLVVYFAVRPPFDPKHIAGRIRGSGEEGRVLFKLISRRVELVEESEKWQNSTCRSKPDWAVECSYPHVQFRTRVRHCPLEV